MYTGVGAIVRYTSTRSDLLLATQLDATGQRYTEAVDPSTVLITCQSNGRWNPDPSNIRVQGCFFFVCSAVRLLLILSLEIAKSTLKNDDIAVLLITFRKPSFQHFILEKKNSLSKLLPNK